MSSKENPLIDTSNVTVNAFNAIKKEEKANASFVLGKDDTETWKSPNFKVKVKAWTQTDNKTHTYFHSLSIDVNVENFMGTAELKCPYDSDLMRYWEPIRQTVVIYGANRGDYKILFIGRVRGVKQDGYELVIEFQNYGWKFKQLVTQSYAKDNVINKDGYTILRLMFEALKIDSYVISPSARYRLKQVGINQDGNLTLNGKELKKMPDLIKRLKWSDPTKAVNKYTLNNKLRENYLHNIKDINYTLKYEKPSKVMKKIASQGSYTSGNNVYENAYGSASASGGGGSGGSSSGGSSSNKGSNTGCKPPHVKMMGNNCKSVPSSLWSSMQDIWEFNRECRGEYSNAKKNITNFSKNYPNTYLSSVSPCLGVLLQYCSRKDKINAAQICKNIGDSQASYRQVTKPLESTISSWQKNASNTINNIANTINKGAQNLHKGLQNAWNGATSFVGSFFK